MPEIDLGKVTGERGPQGTRGSLWYTGTGVTGTAAEGTVMPSSGVDDAKVDDIYLNVSTDDIYICVLEGAADTAKWAYKGSIKGNIGPQGPAGPTGAVDDNTPMTFEQAAARENINSGEAIKTIFGKVKKWFADLGAAAFCGVVNNGTTTAENTVLDGRMGKTLTDKDNDLQGQITALNENLTYTNLASRDGSSFNKDFLNIDATNPLNKVNANACFSKPADDSEWKNVPVSMKGAIWMGYREVVWQTGLHVAVKITEYYPICGRVYYNYYNDASKWGSWASLSPIFNKVLTANNTNKISIPVEGLKQGAYAIVSSVTGNPPDYWITSVNTVDGAIIVHLNKAVTGQFNVNYLIGGK